MRRNDLPPGDWAGRTHGLLIVSLAVGGAAERAGLLIGDIVVDAGGTALETPAALRDVLEKHTAGVLRLAIIRGGAASTVEVDLGI